MHSRCTATIAPPRAQLPPFAAARFSAGATPPSVLELADRLGISAGTARNTVLELGAAGLVHGNGRAGTNVEPVPPRDSRLLDAGAQVAQIAHQVGAAIEDAEAAILVSWTRAPSDAVHAIELTVSTVPPAVTPPDALPQVPLTTPDEWPTEPVEAPETKPSVDDGEEVEDGPWWELDDDYS